MVVSTFSKKNIDESSFLEKKSFSFITVIFFSSVDSIPMENEPTSATLNGDNTDAHSQVNGNADNVSRHSSRVGSAKSGRSKATSVREGVNIDDVDGRKATPPTGGRSPKPEIITNGDQHPTTNVVAKPPTPPVATFDTPNEDYNDDTVNEDDDRLNTEAQAIVSIFPYWASQDNMLL